MSSREAQCLAPMQHLMQGQKPSDAVWLSCQQVHSWTCALCKSSVQCPFMVQSHGPKRTQQASHVECSVRQHVFRKLNEGAWQHGKHSTQKEGPRRPWLGHRIRFCMLTAHCIARLRGTHLCSCHKSRTSRLPYIIRHLWILRMGTALLKGTAGARASLRVRETSSGLSDNQTECRAGVFLGSDASLTLHQ